MSKTGQKSSHHLSASSLFSLQGYVALVTGGATGIGLMCAQTLCANGAKVYIAGRRKDVLDNAIKSHMTDDMAAHGGSLHALPMDVTDKASIKQAVKTIESTDGYLNILVNNAGVKSAKSDVDLGDTNVQAFSDALFNIEQDDWSRTFETNCTAVYFVSVAFVPLLVKGAEKYKSTHERGHPHPSSITIISSMSGITKESQGGQFAYQVSKAGAIQLTRVLSKELSRPNIGIRTNSIAPGYFPSEMTTGESNDKNKSSIPADGFREEKDVPADRAGREEDMAQAILSLVCNQYINGQILPVDGGCKRLFATLWTRARAEVQVSLQGSWNTNKSLATKENVDGVKGQMQDTEVTVPD